MASKPLIGFIGLGLMGLGFIKRYRAQGFDVIGFDVVPDKVAAAEALGARRATSVSDLAKQADIMACSVTTPQNVADIVTSIVDVGARQVGKVFVDHSTTPIQLTVELGEHLKATAGIPFIDAPVSGGPAAAEAGTLAIMAGGDTDAISVI